MLLTPERFTDAIDVRSAVNTVGNGQGSVPVPAEQVEAARTMAGNPIAVEEHPYIQSGTKVLARFAPLAGMEGPVAK